MFFMVLCTDMFVRNFTTGHEGYSFIPLKEQYEHRQGSILENEKDDAFFLNKEKGRGAENCITASSFG
ncbi:MAG: hypothetical protein D3905_12970 [Candidatus Electrothrix sp. AS4_5]|nr:hypothetical protein [Candidatus Electrothrix gigas]